MQCGNLSFHMPCIGTKLEHPTSIQENAINTHCLSNVSTTHDLIKSKEQNIQGMFLQSRLYSVGEEQCRRSVNFQKYIVHLTTIQGSRKKFFLNN